jgi:hypothetical protein
VAPCDCFLFPKIKDTLKGSGFEVVETIEHEVDLENLSERHF